MYIKLIFDPAGGDSNDATWDTVRVTDSNDATWDTVRVTVCHHMTNPAIILVYVRRSLLKEE